MEMTKEVLRDACKANGGYSQPHLNDQLFLQCKGFTEVQNLEAYTNVKVLWLEQNGIMDIEGIGHLERLVSLFLHQNTIRRIKGLDGCRNLRILNLSNNFISKIENLADSVPLLETLQLSHNQVERLEDCYELHKMEFLTSIDLSFNKLERQPNDSDMAVIDFVKPMEQMTVVYLHGNAITHGMKNYRKSMIVAMKNLTYLDERPVFDDERKTTEAWAEGGTAAESDARDAIRKGKVDHLNSCVQVMQKMAAEKKDLKEQREREWQEKRREQEEREKVQRMQRRQLVSGLEDEEDDDRGRMLASEIDEWIEMEIELGNEYVNALKEQAAEEERARVRAEVEKELQQEEKELASKINNADAADQNDNDNTPAAATSNPYTNTANSKSEPSPTSKSGSHSPVIAASTADHHKEPRQKSKKEEEMEYWIKQLEQSDDAVVTQMQGDLEEFLKELQPGYLKPSKEVASAAATRHVDPNSAAATTAAPVKTKKAEKLPVSSLQNNTAPAAASTTTAAPKKAVKKNKFEVWEKYYAFEKKATTTA